MKIALIIENSQAAKSEIVHSALTAVAGPLGPAVHHYGMYTPEDKASLTYVMNGLLAGSLLSSGAADCVVTGCGTGMGSMLAANAMPGVFCGLIIDPTDAFLFGQINDGNAIAMPYAKGFGWAAELNLQDVYRKLFEGERGLGYPKERAQIMATNRGILKELDTGLPVIMVEEAGASIYSASEVARPIHGIPYAAGEHVLRVDGQRFASGVYFYRMEAGGVTLSRKMMLLK